MSEVIAQPNTPEWHERRKEGIGSSESAAAAGVSEYTTTLELYLRKRGELPDKDATDQMRRGLLLEPIIVSEFERKTGIRRQQYPMGLMQHADHRCVLATPDAKLTDKSGLECKSTNWRLAQRLGQEGGEDLPNDWLCQVQQQMAVTGWERVHVAVWIDRDTFRTFCVERNEAAIEMLIQADLELWQRIEAGDPPPHQWTADSRDLVRSLYREIHSDEIIELDSEQAWRWEQRANLKREAKDLLKRAEDIETQILAEVGNAGFAVLPGAERMIRRKEIAKQPYTVTPTPYIDVREVKVSPPVRKLLTEQSNGRSEATAEAVE